MADELDLSGRIFRAGVPELVGDGEPSAPLDVSDLIEVDDDDEPPPQLVDRPELLFHAHSGLHSSLLSTSTQAGAAEAWEQLVEELAEESQHVQDPALRAALQCEAGRVLVDRLGRQEEGTLLMRSSGSAVADHLLRDGSTSVATLANELSALEAQARDEANDEDTRAAAWIEFGLLCEERTPSVARALDAYREALRLVPDHPVGLALAGQAAATIGNLEAAKHYLERRIEGARLPKLRTVLALELAELIPDPTERLQVLARTHADDPREETALRRLIRLRKAEGQLAGLGALYQELAWISEDPVSASTALHLAFLAMLDSGEPVGPLVSDLVARDPAQADDRELLAPLAEVALYVEERIAAGDDPRGLPSNAEVLERLAQSLDDPREQALVREQLARLRLHGLRELLREHPAPSDSITGLPKLDEQRGNVAEALEADLRFCLVHMPEHRWVREALAEVLKARGDLPGLTLHLDEWARTESAGPDRAAILLRLGEVHEQLRNDLLRASETYELAFAEDPDNANGLRALGRVYERMRRWHQAIANLRRQARESDDEQDRIRALRRIASLAEHELGDVDLAVATLEEVARQDRGDVLALYQLGALCRTHGRAASLVGALQLLVERLDDDVARTAVLVELGEVLELQLKQRAEARGCYERALELTPGYTPALQALARLYRDNRELDELLRLLDPGVDPVSDPAVLALRAGRVCVDEIGDIERAIAALERAYRANPDLVPAREQLLQLLTAAGRIEQAYDLLRAQDPPSSPALRADHDYRLGLLAEALARRDGCPDPLRFEDHALQHYRAAIAAQPRHALAYERSRRLLVAHTDADNLALLLEQHLQDATEAAAPALLCQLARVVLGLPDGDARARRAYEAALQAAPGDPLVRREFETFLRLRDDQRSLPALYLSAARETHDTHYRATMLVEAAELLLASGAPEDREVAAQTILDALQADPGNPYAVRHLERVLSESVQTLAVKDAVAARAVRAQSDAERALFYLESGELLELAGHDEQARRAYVAALNAMPELTPATMALERVGSGAARRVEAREVRSSVHVLLAEARDAAVRAGTGDGTAGARALRIVAEVLERDAANRDAIALARALASQFADATPVLTLLEAAFRRVNDADLRYELGLFLGQNAARLEQAVAFYEAAATAKPDGRQALRGLVQSYRQLGDDRRAAEATERLLELYDPGEPTAIDLRMGLATFLSGAAVTLPRALDHAKVVLDARPDDARAILLVADLLERSGQRSQAASTLDRLLVRERDREKLHDLWARKARLLASDPAQQAAAIEAVERAAAMNPGNRDTIDLLVDLLERAGQRERVRAYLQPVRSAVQANIARGAVSLRDVRLLGKVAELADPGLARAAERVMYAIEPSSMPPPEGHAQGATATGLQQLLDTAAMREALYGVGEPPQLHELLRALEPVMGRLAGEFPALDRKQVVPMPVSADPSHYTMALRSWSGLLGLSGLELAALPTHNTAVLLDERPPALHLSANLWMQGDGAAWRGAIAVALARHAFGSARARALSPIELDLLLAAAFESVEVFNPITADPDPRRLRELTSQLTKLVPRRQRRVIEKACQALSSWAFDPSATSRALLATDLRLAVLMSGDIAGCLSAACLFDGAAGGSLKQRLTRSRAGQELLGFLLSDEYLSLR